MIMVEYRQSRGCKNSKALCTCRKCGLCGRKFDGNGFMTEEMKCQKKRKADREDSRRNGT